MARWPEINNGDWLKTRETFLIKNLMLSREESSAVRLYGHCSHSWETILLRKMVLEASESDQKWEINTDLQGEAERCYDASR